MELRLKDLCNIKDLKEEIKYYEKQKGHLKKEIELLHSHDLKTKLAEIETYIDVLNGGEKIKSRFCKLENDEKKLCHNIQTREFKGSKRDFVNIVHEYLYKECGRDYSTDEIANILICIHNNFLTILTGPPGAGKTSVIHFLAESLGNSKNLLSLSTSRGWTSQRDILGYFNPLNKKYQKARTGLYNFISSSNDEFVKFPRWVLLDEANLSPMEHYWADFLGMCDPEGNRRIETGASDEDKCLEIPDSLRFIGTINNDHTTERLSPRLIDRAAIIKLVPKDFFSNSQKYNRNIPVSAFTNETFESVFQESEDYDFNNEEADIVKDIIKILKSESSEFEGAPIIIISPRKYFAIKKYCSTANGVFEKETPLDFAISQHILPQIEGYGTGLVKRLTRLQEIHTNNGFNRSEKTLERIIYSGKQNHHSYSFFG